MPHFMDMLKHMEKIIGSASEEELNVVVDLHLDNPNVQPTYINCNRRRTKGPFPTKTEALMYQQMLKMEKLLPKGEKKRATKRPVKLDTKGMKIAAGLAAVLERAARAASSAADTGDESDSNDEEGPEPLAALTESMIDCRSTPPSPPTLPPPPQSEQSLKTPKPGPFGFVELPIVVPTPPRLLQLLSVLQKPVQHSGRIESAKTVPCCSESSTPMQSSQRTVSVRDSQPVQDRKPPLAPAVPTQPLQPLSTNFQFTASNLVGADSTLLAPAESTSAVIQLSADCVRSQRQAAPVEQPTAMFKGRLYKLPIVIPVPQSVRAFFSRYEAAYCGNGTALSARSARQISTPVEASDSTEPPAKRPRIS